MSESVLIQRALQKAYNVDRNRHRVGFILKAMALSGAGLILGFMVGLLSAQ
jgi:hypothetical protein